jgi:hypothetical protein
MLHRLYSSRFEYGSNRRNRISNTIPWLTTSCLESRTTSCRPPSREPISHIGSPAQNMGAHDSKASRKTSEASTLLASPRTTRSAQCLVDNMTPIDAPAQVAHATDLEDSRAKTPSI